jgi:predicted Zn-dependent protease
MTTIKTIDIQAKEWFDKINGNSYFAGTITVNFGMPDAKTIIMPYQYGYGDHYVDMAAKALEENNIITDRTHHSNGSAQSLWSYCDDKGIILRKSKQQGCKKRDLKAIAA